MTTVQQNFHFSTQAQYPSLGFVTVQEIQNTTNNKKKQRRNLDSGADRCPREFAFPPPPPRDLAHRGQIPRDLAPPEPNPLGSRRPCVPPLGISPPSLPATQLREYSCI